jgi:hypothetical protein
VSLFSIPDTDWLNGLNPDLRGRRQRLTAWAEARPVHTHLKYQLSYSFVLESGSYRRPECFLRFWCWYPAITHICKAPSFHILRSYSPTIWCPFLSSYRHSVVRKMHEVNEWRPSVTTKFFSYYYYYYYYYITLTHKIFWLKYKSHHQIKLEYHSK